MSKNHYLGIKNEEQRMVWSGLSSPLQHVLNVQELWRRKTQKFNYRGFRINTQQSQTQTMGNKWSTVAQGGRLKWRNDKCEAEKSNECNTSGIWVTQEVRFYSVHCEFLPVSAVCVEGMSGWNEGDYLPYVPGHCPLAGPRLSHRPVLSSFLPPGCQLS